MFKQHVLNNISLLILKQYRSYTLQAESSNKNSNRHAYISQMGNDEVERHNLIMKNR
jgi:hypothetical protein